MNIRNALAKAWTVWKRFGRAVGDFIGRLVLTVFYFTVLVPFGIGVLIMERRQEFSEWASGLWIERSYVADTLMKAKRLH